MAPFFRWHGHEGNWRLRDGRRHWDNGHRRDWDRWHRPEGPGPGPSPGPSPGPDLLQSVVSAATAPITAPFKAIGGLLGLEIEDPFPLADEEAETHRGRHRRPQLARYQSGDENSESVDEFAPAGRQTETRRRTGRWIHRDGAIILLGV
jgi:hypothetical protein